ncbi:MAG: PhoH-like protein [Chlamydiae bacterium]|nr:PhoH-like protein [Chlamydiota bacterium]
MARKTFVLDTTVLLHDPDAIQKFDGNDVVMPLIVLEELDRMKRFTTELGKNARTVIRFIDGLKGDLFKGIELENGVNFSIYLESKVSEREGFPLPLDSTKHHILFAAYKLQLAGKDVVVLISKDFVLRIKAESIGLKAQDYETLKESFDNLYRGYRRVDLPKPQLDAFMTKGSIELPGEELLPNEYCWFNSGKKSPLIGKYNAKTKSVEALDSIGNEVWGVRPLNDEQKCAMDLLMRDDINLVSMIGQAGTGKTLMALTCGLRKVFDEGVYKRILISRPIMPLGKDIGYLPGTKEEKMVHWMQPIYDNLEYICETTSGSGNGAETKQWILESEKIEMEAVTFIRGRSLANTYIIIDEAQNLTPHEVKTIISRAGKGTKVVLTGDPTQIDNPYLDKDSNALTYVVSRFKTYGIYGHIFFEKTERSELAAIAAKVL